MLTWFSWYAHANRYYTLLLQLDQVSFNQVNKYYVKNIYEKFHYDSPIDVLLAESLESSNIVLAREYYSNYISDHQKDDRAIYRYCLFLTFCAKDYCEAINQLNLFKKIRTDYNGIVLLEEFLRLKPGLNQKIEGSKGESENKRVYRLINECIIFYKGVSDEPNLYQRESLVELEKFLYILFLKELSNDLRRVQIRELRADFSKLKSIYFSDNNVK